jgi:dihydrofolate reductase
MDNFNLIVCVNKKNVIGRNGDLLFHIHNDLKNFKRMTTDNVVIMGRKTFESLPGKKPLPNRHNIIVTSDENYKVEGYDNVSIVHSYDEAKDFCIAFFPTKEWFVIGGKSAYNWFLINHLIGTAYVTCVDENSKLEGDTILNEDFNDEYVWKLFYQAPQLEEDGIKYNFSIYKFNSYNFK